MLELDSDGSPFQDHRSRIIRVARGSGTSVHEVEEILSQYQRFSSMVKTMGGKNGLMNNLPTDPKKINRNNRGQMQNMARAQQQMANMIPPGMLQQMGGMEGIQNMARSMFGGGGAGGRGGGMPDMSQLMKMMGGGQ